MTSQPTAAPAPAPAGGGGSATVFAMPPPDQGGAAIAMPAPAPAQPPSYDDVMNEKTALNKDSGEKKGYNSNG